MTKKSLARQQRDRMAEELKDNRCWDELNGIYDSARVMLGQHASIHTLASDKNLQACLENPTSTANSIKILARDLKTLSDDLNAIHQRHDGKVGGSQDPNEVMTAIGIGQDYAILTERHVAVVQPTAFKILEDFQQAETKLANIRAQNIELAKQNAGEIVDAEFTEQSQQQ